MRTLFLAIVLFCLSSSCVVVESPEPEPEDTRLQCGAAVAPCGCYGPVGPGTRFQESACRTGTADAVPCTANGPYCAGVTYPWFPRCTC